MASWATNMNLTFRGSFSASANRARSACARCGTDKGTTTVSIASLVTPQDSDSKSLSRLWSKSTSFNVLVPPHDDDDDDDDRRVGPNQAECLGQGSRFSNERLVDGVCRGFRFAD